VEGNRPASLYLVVPPSDISRPSAGAVDPQQIGRRLTEDLHAKDVDIAVADAG